MKRRQIPVLKQVRSFLGWNPTIEQKIPALDREIDGLEARVHALARAEKMKIMPHAIRGERVFEADTKAPVTIDGNPHYYLIRDAGVHELPIRIPGPGFFVANYFSAFFYRLDGEKKAGVRGGSVSGHDWTSATPFSFLWNLEDAGSGRKLSSGMLHSTLLSVDGAGFFEFDVPWELGSNNNVTFSFQTGARITNLVSTYNTGIKALVRVELHGTRYLP